MAGAGRTFGSLLCALALAGCSGTRFGDQLARSFSAPPAQPAQPVSPAPNPATATPASKAAAPPTAAPTAVLLPLPCMISYCCTAAPPPSDSLNSRMYYNAATTLKFVISTLERHRIAFFENLSPKLSLFFQLCCLFAFNKEIKNEVVRSAAQKFFEALQ